MVLQYLTGKEDHYRCMYGVLGLCFNISQGKRIIIDAFRRTLKMCVWCICIVLQNLQGKKIIRDACMVYLHGASISHRVRRSL